MSVRFNPCIDPKTGAYTCGNRQSFAYSTGPRPKPSSKPSSRPSSRPSSQPSSQPSEKPGIISNTANHRGHYKAAPSIAFGAKASGTLTDYEIEQAKLVEASYRYRRDSPLAAETYLQNEGITNYTLDHELSNPEATVWRNTFTDQDHIVSNGSRMPRFSNTIMDTLDDWKTNFQGFKGSYRDTTQYKTFLKLTERVANKKYLNSGTTEVISSPITDWRYKPLVSGHSKGGTFARLAAEEHDLVSMGFNPAISYKDITESFMDSGKKLSFDVPLLGKQSFKLPAWASGKMLWGERGYHRMIRTQNDIASIGGAFAPRHWDLKSVPELQPNSGIGQSHNHDNFLQRGEHGNVNRSHVTNMIGAFVSGVAGAKIIHFVDPRAQGFRRDVEVAGAGQAIGSIASEILSSGAQNALFSRPGFSTTMGVVAADVPIAVATYSLGQGVNMAADAALNSMDVHESIRQPIATGIGGFVTGGSYQGVMNNKENLTQMLRNSLQGTTTTAEVAGDVEMTTMGFAETLAAEEVAFETLVAPLDAPTGGMSAVAAGVLGAAVAVGTYYGQDIEHGLSTAAHGIERGFEAAAAVTEGEIGNIINRIF